MFQDDSRSFPERTDDADGTNSDILNEASDEQGNCGEPHGPSTVGLIYVNLQGVGGDPNATR